MIGISLQIRDRQWSTNRGAQKASSSSATAGNSTFHTGSDQRTKRFSERTIMHIWPSRRTEFPALGTVFLLDAVSPLN